MTIEEKSHVLEVSIAYAGSIILIAALILLTLLQARQARIDLDRIEGRDG
jgi:hypothetical protein